MSYTIDFDRRRFIGAALATFAVPELVVSTSWQCSIWKWGARKTTQWPSHVMAVIAGQGECNENGESRGGPTESRPP